MAGDDVVGDVKEEAKRRLRSSYALSYVLAWCAVNYEFLIVVFSEGGYTDKIGYVALHLHYGQSSFVTFGVPALLAFIPVFLLPVLNQLADLWSKAVEVGGTHLSGRLESGKWASDAELVVLARNRSFELDSLRGYAKELFKAHASLVGAKSQREGPGKADWVRLPGAKAPSSGVVGALAEMVEGPGFPVGGYEMLKYLQDQGPSTEEQLRITVSRYQAGEESRDLVAILSIAGLIDFKWTTGPRPTFTLTREGGLFLKFVAEKHPEAFGSQI